MCDQETLTKVHLMDKEREKERRQGCVKAEKNIACLSDYMDKWRERKRPAIQYKFVEREDG